MLILFTIAKINENLRAHKTSFILNLHCSLLDGSDVCSVVVKYCLFFLRTPSKEGYNLVFVTAGCQLIRTLPVASGDALS